MMGSDKPFRVVVEYDYVDPSTGISSVMRTLHGPYELKHTAKSQGKRIANSSAYWFKTGTNHRYRIEQCDGWTELEEYYV